MLPLVALALIAVVTAGGGNDDNNHTAFQPDDDLPGKPIGIGKPFTRFTLPGGQFRVFYAVLDKHNALDLIRVHCVIEKSGHGDKDRNFVQVTVSNGRTSASFSFPDSISNGSLLYEGSRTVQPLEVSDFEDDQEHTITTTVSSRALFTLSGSIRFVSYDRSQYNVV
ncbi:hypothetical protein Y032_0010g1165 [Ancylostoma ceylanicum]|nr:hypothetical protein Y032_0010g1165 [Ancylostoma ceylanicum]